MESIVREMDAEKAGQDDKVITKPFEISVNRKPVEVAGPIVTGLEIKEASIKQGLPIEVSFQLAEVEARREGDGSSATRTRSTCGSPRRSSPPPTTTTRRVKASR